MNVTQQNSAQENRQQDYLFIFFLANFFFKVIISTLSYAWFSLDGCLYSKIHLSPSFDTYVQVATLSHILVQVGTLGHILVQVGTLGHILVQVATQGHRLVQVATQ